MVQPRQRSDRLRSVLADKENVGGGKTSQSFASWNMHRRILEGAKKSKLFPSSPSKVNKAAPSPRKPTESNDQENVDPSNIHQAHGADENSSKRITTQRTSSSASPSKNRLTVQIFAADENLLKPRFPASARLTVQRGSAVREKPVFAPRQRSAKPKSVSPSPSTQKCKKGENDAKERSDVTAKQRQPQPKKGTNTARPQKSVSPSASKLQAQKNPVSKNGHHTASPTAQKLAKEATAKAKPVSPVTQPQDHGKDQCANKNNVRSITQSAQNTTKSTRLQKPKSAAPAPSAHPPQKKVVVNAIPKSVSPSRQKLINQNLLKKPVSVSPTRNKLEKDINLQALSANARFVHKDAFSSSTDQVANKPTGDIGNLPLREVRVPKAQNATGAVFKARVSTFANGAQHFRNDLRSYPPKKADSKPTPRGGEKWLPRGTVCAGTWNFIWSCTHLESYVGTSIKKMTECRPRSSIQSSTKLRSTLSSSNWIPKIPIGMQFDSESQTVRSVSHQS